jgi:hypothetical protein
MQRRIIVELTKQEEAKIEKTADKAQEYMLHTFYSLLRFRNELIEDGGWSLQDAHNHILDVLQFLTFSVVSNSRTNEMALKLSRPQFETFLKEWKKDSDEMMQEMMEKCVLMFPSRNENAADIN